MDELLGRKEFVELWVMKWAELLQIRSGGEQNFSYKSALLYYNWLQDKLSHDVPMDKIVQELLGATGGTFKDPATNYYQITNDTLKLAENTAQVFMGMRVQCAHATIIRSIDGRWMTTTALPPSSHRSAASRPKIRES